LWQKIVWRQSRIEVAMTKIELYQILYRRFDKNILSAKEIAGELGIAYKSALKQLEEGKFCITASKPDGKWQISLLDYCDFLFRSQEPVGRQSEVLQQSETAVSARRSRGRPKKPTYAAARWAQ
jgi:hypothetical protein